MQNQNTTYRRKGKRRVRWDRILGLALVLAAVCAAVLLAVKHRAPQQATGQPQGDAQTQGDANQNGAARGDATPDGAGQGGAAQPNAPAAPAVAKSFVAPTAFALDGLRLANSTMNGQGSYTQDRYYYLYLPEMSVSKLAYFDYPSRQLQLLCTVPGCAHDGPGCEAFFTTGGINFACSPWNTWVTLYDPAGECLQYVTETGQRSATCFQAPEVESTLTVVAENESTLLFTTNATSSTGSGEKKFYLYNKTSGEAQSFMTLGGEEVVAVYDRFLVVSHNGFDAEANSVLQYIRIDLASGEEQLLCATPTGDRYLPVRAAGQYLYFLQRVDSERCAFVRRDIGTQEDTVLNDQVSCPESQSVSPRAKMLDDHLCWTVTAPEGAESRYTIDCATGEMQPDVSPAVLVEAVFAEHFLVSGSDIATQHALVAKADYWAGAANYSPVADLA